MSETLPKRIPVKILAESEDVLPRYAKPGDAGCDGRANITTPLQITPGSSALIPLGIAVAIPEGYEIQVRPRSGLALKHQVSVLNSPGTIDAGFRNQLGVIIINLGNQPFQINPGDRICQLVLNKVETIEWQLTHELPPSERGAGGFGHSGV